MRLPRLHLVTSDDVLCAPGFASRLERVLEACGADVALHVRGHGLQGRALHALAEHVRRGAERTGALVLVNDRVDVAMAAGVHGIQLGRRSLPIAEARRLLGAAAWIGYSAHAAEEAASAVRAGADFVVLGTVYPTATHPGEPGAGVGRIREGAAVAGAPVVAIGGITPGRVGAVLRAGAYGVAVLSGVWSAADPAGAALDYLEALREGASHGGDDRDHVER
ncbi:MAG TPA: thiamine phosphate synthase [Longimicrobiales bacterium]